MTLLFCLVLFAAGIWGTAVLAFFVRRKHRVYLSDVSPKMPPGGWPSVTIVVAGRNEGTTIEPALRSLLKIDYPDFKIRAVNDRSEDQTGKIMDRVAQDDRRLEVRHVTELPPGWLGKNHALHTGITGVTTDYILFTDADVVFAPEALKKALSYAVKARLDMLAVFPELLRTSVMETSIVTVFASLLSLKYQNWMIEHPKIRNYIGIGAFNLLRREVLARIGGFEHLRLSVDDDIRLGEAVKVHGFRLKVIYGVGEIKVRWQEDFWGYLKGLEKNAFASAYYRMPDLMCQVIGTFVICVVPFFAVAFGTPWTRALAALTLVLIATLLNVGSRSTGGGARYLLLVPVSGLAMCYALVNSMVKTLRQNGIVWRNYHYSLPELRAHTRERTRWLDAAWKETRANARGHRVK